MRIINFVEEVREIKRMLIPLNLWEIPKDKRAPPKKREIDPFTDYCPDEDPGWEMYCRDPGYEETCMVL